MKKHVKKLYRCEICDKNGFTTSYKLKSHLFIHKAIPARFRCSYCWKEFYRSDEHKKHVNSHMNEQKPKRKMHFCDHCGRGFVDKRNLINHLYIHDDLFVPSKRYSCNACNISYCEHRLLKYHIRKHHLNLETNVPLYTEKKLNESWIETAMDSTCVQITKVKNNMLSIKKCKAATKVEIKEENEKDPLQNYMASTFALKGNLYSKAICDYCNKEMLKKSIHKHIRERHLHTRKFACFVCKRRFNRHYQIAEHNCGRVRHTKNNTLF